MGTGFQEPGTELTLVHFDQARHALELAATIDEVKGIRDQAEALRQYARQSRQGLEMQNRCAEIKLRAERRAGEMLAVMPKNPGGQREHESYQSQDVTSRPTLADVGVTPMQSSRWQAVAAIPQERFEEHIREAITEDHELTTAGLLRAADRPHVANNSGENEWYTPAEYTASARAVMGAIDCDPASSALANETVQATTFHTIADDGRTQPWGTRVWMNPPYAQPLCADFCTSMMQRVRLGEVEEACVLVNNATETAWFGSLISVARAVCFPRRRIRFVAIDGEKGAPLQGQAIIYIGPNRERFSDEFGSFGWLAWL